MDLSKYHELELRDIKLRCKGLRSRKWQSQNLNEGVADFRAHSPNPIIGVPIVLLVNEFWATTVCTKNKMISTIRVMGLMRKLRTLGPDSPWCGQPASSPSTILPLTGGRGKV